jgi:uncharacterized protein (TIGR02266 family)
VSTDNEHAGFIEYGTGPDNPGSRSPWGPNTPTPEFAPAAVTAAPVGPARAEPSPEARRGHARAPYVTVAALLRDNGTTTSARTEDISEGGVLLISDEPYGAGEIVRLRFALPISGRVTTLRSTVRWTRKARGAPATGLEFNELPAEPRAEIQRYVALMTRPRAR